MLGTHMRKRSDSHVIEGDAYTDTERSVLTKN